jgi:hypothetical protein
VAVAVAYGVNTPDTLAAAVVAGAAHVGLLLTGHPRLKLAATWAGTLAAALILAAAKWEGADGLSLGTIAQWDSHDLGMIVALAGASVLHTIVPNAPAVFRPVLDAVAAAGIAHLPAPEAPAAGDAVDPASVTGLLPVVPALSALTVADDADELDAHDAPRHAAVTL